jgi:SNF2 family DNA or RNA helicase
VEKQLIIDFSAHPRQVWAIAEAERLGYGYLFNPTFATETSLIEPLPHQRIAVYKYLLKSHRLRFLLADDAGAGKTIMTGLYIREMLSRRLINRVIVIPPAGLMGNWQREMNKLFSLQIQNPHVKLSGKNETHTVINESEIVKAAVQVPSEEKSSLSLNQRHRLTAKADLESNEIQDLAEQLGAIKNAAVGFDLKLKLQINLEGSSSKSEEVISQINQLLESISSDLKLQ